MPWKSVLLGWEAGGTFPAEQDAALQHLVMLGKIKLRRNPRDAALPFVKR